MLSESSKTIPKTQSWQDHPLLKSPRSIIPVAVFSLRFPGSLYTTLQCCIIFSEYLTLATPRHTTASHPQSQAFIHSFISLSVLRFWLLVSSTVHRQRNPYWPCTTDHQGTTTRPKIAHISTLSTERPATSRLRPPPAPPLPLPAG